MHRATPANSSFRAYSAGGARALISAIDDLKGIQEVAGSFMRGEARKGIEAPHSYGFSAVPFDADKPGEDGKPGLGPEAFVSFIGGNRSFPSMGPIDDRRHRMKGLEKGDTCIFSGKESGQNLHLNGVGTFLNTFPGKKLRLQIVEKVKQATGGGASTFAEGDTGGGQADAKEELGQRPNYKNPSTQYLEVTDDGTDSVNKKQSVRLPDGTAVHLEDGKCYLGGRPQDGGTFSPVLTVAGQSSNVLAKVG
jgi:Bacteriophage Mu Gp45 spike protein